jgi:hypothetical protein
MSFTLRENNPLKDEIIWALTHRHAGRTDLALAEDGEDEAQQIGTRLSQGAETERAIQRWETDGGEIPPEVGPGIKFGAG